MTTILSVRKNNDVIIAGDGQATLGQSVVMKTKTNKIRKLAKGSIIAGFAGTTADAIALIERLEEKLEKYPNQLIRACVELTKDWRMDKYLRKLEAVLIVANKEKTFILTGTGDVLEPDDGVVGIGSGGNYAMAAAKAMIDNDNLSIEEIAKRAMDIAADIDVYTNHNIILEKVK